MLRTFFGTLRRMAACAALLLAACGGGGGDPGVTPFGGATGGTGGTGGTATPRLVVSVSPKTVTAAAPATVSATVTTASGAAVPGQVVQFTTASGLGRFSATSALTDGAGVATVRLSPASASTTGADTVTASTTVGALAVSGSDGFQLTATDVSIASFTSDIATALAPYGQTTLTVTLSAGAPGNPTNISVSSSCVNRGLATLTPAATTTSTGTATFTFRDNGCGADLRDTLQASVTGTTSTSSLTISLTPPTVASISFVSATPEAIFLRGSGFVENSTVVFRVRDAAGNGVRGQTVALEPTTLAGGLRVDDLGSLSDFPISKLTDSNGNVVVRVNSGTVPTPVRIRASLTVAGAEISTVSSTLAIAVGLPSQLNFSLSQRTRNIEGYSIDGTTNTYTIIASDRLGNPVPDGTAINFVSEGGQVQAIRFTETNNGLSSAVANFQTASPRPVDGRVTVLAYALGEKSFIDANGDNVYSAAESFIDANGDNVYNGSEKFTDANGDKIYNAAELFQDLGDPYLDRYFNGLYGSAHNQFIPQSPPAIKPCGASTSPLLALDPSMPSRPDTCSQQWGRSYVRRATETIFSTSAARPLWGTQLPAGSAVPAGLGCPAGLSLIRANTFEAPAYDGAGAPQRTTYFPFGSTSLHDVGLNGVLAFFAADANPVAFNPVAADTVVTATATEGLAVTVAGGSPVSSTTVPTGVAVVFSFAPGITGGTVTVTFRSPGGLGTSFSQSLSRSAPPAGYVSCP